MFNLKEFKKGKQEIHEKTFKNMTPFFKYAFNCENQKTYKITINLPRTQFCEIVDIKEAIKKSKEKNYKIVKF